MTTKSNLHPCFTCRLPDCDDRSRQCGLRVAKNEYCRRLKAKEDIPSGLREQYNIAYRELYGAHHNENRRKADGGQA